MSHPIKPRAPLFEKRKIAAPSWPTYQGASQLVGTSRSNVTVWVDPSLGAQAFANANDLLAYADRIVAANNGFFGTLGGPVDVILFALDGMTDGTGGADHNACSYVDGGAIEVCVSYGRSARCAALFEAELSECAMGGNLCGQSTGEALSRWCAMDISNNALADFASAPVWQQDGSPNFVDSVDPTDQNYDSIGCGMAFLSWLMATTKHSLADVAKAMVTLGDGGTLALLYAILTDKPSTAAWPAFIAAVRVLGVITSDDPFGAMAAPAPAPPPAPPPGPAQQIITIQGTIISQVPVPTH